MKRLENNYWKLQCIKFIAVMGEEYCSNVCINHNISDCNNNYNIYENIQ